MENLVTVFENDKVVVSSKMVAEKFDKQHRNVLRDIKEILAAQNSAARFFYETTFNNRGKQYPMYLMNRDGFSLLVMGFTGKEALQWKIKFIDAFNKMEWKLNNQNKIALIELQSKYNKLDKELQKTEKKWRHWVLNGAKDYIVLGYFQSMMMLKGSIVQEDFDTVMNFVKDNIIQLQDKIERENGNL